MNLFTFEDIVATAGRRRSTEHQHLNRKIEGIFREEFSASFLESSAVCDDVPASDLADPLETSVQGLGVGGNDTGPFAHGEREA
jgi:hypothetical protein